MAIGLELVDTTFEGPELEETHRLDEKDGQIINFWIQNNGEAGVEISINEENNRIFEPGEQGHISFEAKDLLGFIDKKYLFKAVSTQEGVNINIAYRIAQRFEEME
ncbi:hypothetical protein AN639_12530 [Candidatus Epulonipiscium fishelsonii]|nr:hypothetical protein AN639_12530 [Epulopiscium sp. SCG-B05WGA-EpuloA1]